jgi:hypothetical protein
MAKLEETSDGDSVVEQVKSNDEPSSRKERDASESDVHDAKSSEDGSEEDEEEYEIEAILSAKKGMFPQVCTLIYYK